MSTRLSSRGSDEASERNTFERSRLRRQRQRSKSLAILGTGVGVAALAVAFFSRGRESPANLVVTQAQASPVIVATSTPKPTPTPFLQSVIAPWARGKTLRSVPVKPGQKVIALTFDDGPWPHSTAEVLGILRDNNVKATFYMVGQEVSRRPQIARLVRDAGHAIGNHSWDHPSRPRSPVSQVTRTDAVIKRELGFTPTTFRPPYGIKHNGMAARAMKEGDAVILWTADSTDWSRPGSAKIASRVLRQASSGGIVLMHDGGGPRSQTVAALPIIIGTLRSRGYKFVTVPELLAMRYVAPKATKKPASKVKNKKTSIHKKS